MKTTRNDYEDFLIWERFKFLTEETAGENGNETAALKAAIWTAYRDLQRTLHGFGKFPEDQKSKIKDDSETAILRFLEKLRGTKNQEEFDRHHTEVCSKLRKIFYEQKYCKFTFGHSQKWVNMTLKYIFVMGKGRTGGQYERIYEYCHVPIDAYFLKEIDKAEREKFGLVPWSKIPDYQNYLDFQKWFRGKESAPPLDREFGMWLRAARREHGR